MFIVIETKTADETARALALNLTEGNVIATGANYAELIDELESVQIERAWDSLVIGPMRQAVADGLQDDLSAQMHGAVNKTPFAVDGETVEPNEPE